jgi:hypothetical protein
LKHGSYNRLKSNDSGVASVPGAKQESAEDMTQAERLKHGYRKSPSNDSNAASMPGAKQERADDMSQAERLKSGSYNRLKSSGSGVASVPGAKQESAEDMTQAERLKHGYRKSPSNDSNAASMPGAKQERADDISQAERLKYGQASLDSRQTIPGVSTATDHDVDAAARLKFRQNERNENTNIPGAVQGVNSNTSEAERIKFGLVQQFADGGDVSVEESDDNSINEEDEADMTNGEYHDDESDEEHLDVEANRAVESNQRVREPMRSRVKSVRSSLRQSWLSDASSEYSRPDSSGKRDVDIWKPLCEVCTCISFVIIIALSASLGAANRKTPAEASLVVTSAPIKIVAATDMPTISPSIAPTTAPDDYSFCYEQNELVLLNNERYSSIRSELISSGVSSRNDFSTTSSYQRKALCWLAFGDRLHINTTDHFLEQRYALSTIYFGLNESQQLLEKGWLSGKSECQWAPMVECDSRTDSTVTKLALYGNELSGNLPKEMSYLKDTSYLDVSMNNIVGDITESLGSWTNLVSLRLSSNVFTSIPDLSIFPALKNFDINSNKITGSIPEELASLNLVYLDLSTNYFDGTIPTILGEMKSLESLYLHLNDNTGVVPEEICALRTANLQSLTTDCQPPGPEVECPATCCTGCSFYDGGNDPF